MAVTGQALSTFSIDGLPANKDFQVILESKLMVIGTDGVELGHSDTCVISRPFKCLDSGDSELVIKDWLLYSKEKNLLVKPDTEDQSDIIINFSVSGKIDEAKIEDIIDNYLVEHEAKESDLRTDDRAEIELLDTETSTDFNVELQKRTRNHSLSEKICFTTKQNKSNTKRKASKENTCSKNTSEGSKARKRGRSKTEDKRAPKVKFKRRTADKYNENEIEIQKVKTEQDDPSAIVEFKDSGSPISDDSIEIKAEGSLNECEPELDDDIVNRRKRVPRQRNRNLKTLRVTTTKRRKQKKNQEDATVLVNTEGIDQKLVYAKRSLEKQNIKNSKRIRVELEEHCDKYRITVVESLAQKDRGKSFEEKSYQSYECTICGRFQSAIPEKIRFHVEQHVNGELECKKCGYILSYPKEISRHNNEVHKSDFVNKRVCELCGMTARSFRMWKAHMSKIHKVPSFKCKHCFEKFFNAAEVVVHTREAHKDIILTCDKCGQIFVSRSNWSYHSVRCNGTANADSFVCDQCGKNLGSGIALKRHVRHNHEMEKTQKCTVCSYATHTIARLQKHINAHLGNKQYHCEICQFSCVQKYQLTSHMRTHNGVKPFHCDQCPYAVAWNVQLKAHKKVHGLAMAVTCKTCGVVYRDAKTLSKHEQKDHGEKSRSDNGIINGITKDGDVSNIPIGNISANSCISNNFNTIPDAGQGLFMNDTRNVINGMTGTLPSFNNHGMMNVNSNIRNHLGQLENNQVQLPAQVPLFPFSYQ